MISSSCLFLPPSPNLSLSPHWGKILFFWKKSISYWKSAKVFANKGLKTTTQITIFFVFFVMGTKTWLYSVQAAKRRVGVLIWKKSGGVDMAFYFGKKHGLHAKWPISPIPLSLTHFPHLTLHLIFLPLNL